MELTLFEECLQKLGHRAVILSTKETEKIEIVLQQFFPFIVGNIDWGKNKNHQVIENSSPSKITSILKTLLRQSTFDKIVYIIWDCLEPAIKTDLYTAIEFFDDITSVSTRTWLFNPNIGYGIEWHWNGNKTVGIASYERAQRGKALEDFLDSLGNEFKILSSDESKKIFKQLKNKFGFGKILVDWKIISRLKEVQSPEKISEYLEELEPGLSRSTYLLWNESDQLPIIETDLNLILKNWNKLVAVGFLKYIFNKEAQYVIELGIDKILIGLQPKRL